MHDFIVETESFDPLVVESGPGHRPSQITALGRGFRCGEGLGATVQRFPVGQSGTFFLHVHRIPPFLFGIHAGLAEIDGLASRQRCIHGLLACGFPHFHGDVQITGFKTGKLRDVIRLNIFDVVSGLFQHLAHQGGGQILPGPVMQGQFNRILGLDGACRHGQSRENGKQQGFQ